LIFVDCTKNNQNIIEFSEKVEMSKELDMTSNFSYFPFVYPWATVLKQDL